MKLNKLRKAAMTIEFIIVVSILVLIGCVGTSYVFANYETLTTKANKVEDSIIIKGDGTVVGGGSQEDGGETPEGGNPEVESLTFNIYHVNSSSKKTTSNYTQIEYEAGMTWGEFVNSSYNTVNAVLDSDGLIQIGNSYLFIECEGNPWDYETMPDVLGNVEIGNNSVIILVAPPTLTFSSPAGTFEFEEGMTWYDWINSGYNTDFGKFYINESDEVRYGGGNKIFHSSDEMTTIYGSSVIRSDGYYDYH